MAKSKYVQQRSLTSAEQAYHLTTAFPQFRIRAMRNDLRCVGLLQPTYVSDKYTIELTYREPDRPRVRVIHPQLRLANGHSRLPHVFPGGELCLYTVGEWRPNRKISDFIIPWVSLWLAFYEVWLITGEWLGGGHEPSSGKK